MKEQERVVRDFIEAWNQMSFEEVISHLGEDIYYHLESIITGVQDVVEVRPQKISKVGFNKMLEKFN